MAVVAIIDDDASIRDAVRLLIEGEGWISRTYASGEAFLEDRPRNSEVDCLILDPHLGGISGADVAQALVNAQFPIIGLTARPTSSITQRVMNYGIKVMLTKPVRSEKLIATICCAIDSDV